MRRIVAVIAGVVVAYVLYVVLALALLAPDADLPVALFLPMSLATFIGGVLCGYIAQTVPPPRYAVAILYSPGLYLFLAGIPFLADTIQEAKELMVAAGLVWILASIPGVLFGVRLHEQRAAV
jgi:hypothetical protein